MFIFTILASIVIEGNRDDMSCVIPVFLCGEKQREHISEEKSLRDVSYIYL